MNLIPIENLDIPELQIYRTMRGNAFDKENSFVADSSKVVNILLKSDIAIKSLLATEDYYAEHKNLIQSREIHKLYVGEKSLLETIVGHKMHHGVMMHGVRPDSVPLDALDDRIILLDELSNMENVGAIARSAAALGVGSFVMPKSAPHPYGRRAIRVSMGYVSRLKVHRFDDIGETLIVLKALGYTVYGAEASSEAVPLASVKDTPNKWVVVMGNEDAGLSDEVIGLCDYVVKIEMAEGVKSFNVAIAASIVMHWLTVHGSGD